MSFRFQFRRGTTAERNASNPILAAGEPAVVLDSGQPAELVLGDGVTAMADLRAAVWDDDARLTAAATATQPGDLGTAAAANVADLATAAQGAKADTAVQPAELTEGLAAKAPLNHQPVKPRLTLYPTRTDGLRFVLYQSGSTCYSAGQTTAGTIYRSTDDGRTWTTMGALGHLPKAMTVVPGTGTLITVQDTSSTTPGLNPKVMRSTDNGATWAQVTTLNYPPHGPHGITATPSGVILIGEYGNVASTAYRVMRSTDDGQTWAAVLTGPGTDPLSDPGHIHSVRWDPYRERLVAFMDRPDPEVYVSDDEGATWEKIGTSTGLLTPNAVTFMFFEEHVAWGFDNASNGKIGRLPADDFYSGAWSYAEVVAELDRKAFYGTFPLREGVWLIAQATELIGGDPYGPGSYACEAFIVDQGGARVSGALEHASPLASQGTLGGHVITLPNFDNASYDNGGKVLLNLPNGGLPYAWAMVPASMGVSVDLPRTAHAPPGPLILHNDVGAWARDTGGTLRQILQYDGANRTSLRNTYGAGMPEVRLYEGATGIIGMVFAGAIVAAFVSDGRLQMVTDTYIEMGNTAGAPRIMAGTGTPEGSKTAPPGSTYHRRDGGAGTSFYVKESGTGNTGWVGK